MTTEQQTSVQPPDRRGPSSAPAVAASARDWTSSPLVADVLAGLSGEGPRFVARAPGRLDVMGGLAEYTGSLVLHTTISDHVCAASQRRTDGVISIRFIGPAGGNGTSPLAMPLSRLAGPDGAPVKGAQGGTVVGGDDAHHTRCVVGVLAEALRAQLVADLDGGLSIAVGSTLDQLTDAGQDAALAAAVLVAVAGVTGVKLEALAAARVCERVANDWLRLPIGPADAAGILVGTPQAVTQLRCDPCRPAGVIRLPSDVRLVGLDCGVTHPQAAERYERVRTAAFMGRLLIDRIIQHEGAGHLRWEGYLSRISITDYVEMFRNRLPTKLIGRDFLDRFGETGDPLTRIEPDFVYKIRSRTEHHIYEHARACQFAECLARAIRNSDVGVLAELGEPMYASHWSYGQRCGLGSVETDLLVTLLRRHGPEADIYGAKTTGRGSGGIVAVLLRPTDRAIAALEATLADYETRTGRTALLIRGSIAGALTGNSRSV